MKGSDDLRITKWLSIVLSTVLILTSFASPIAANELESLVAAGKYASKDEVIYGKLTATGEINNLYVVNSFQIDIPGEMIDYGSYTNVRNLTNLTAIEQTDQDQVVFQAEEDEFYYQGELANHALPWDISIVYLLDGETKAPSELAGQSGQLEIQITTEANEEVDSIFFEHYMLQISLTLDPAVFSNIQAPKGTEANAGKNKMINFTAMPNQAGEFILSATVTDFEMDPIDITAIPANIAIDAPEIDDFTDDIETLSDAIRQVNEGVSQLNEGISEMNDGTSELSDGSSEFAKGMQTLNQSSGELINGSQQIRDALEQISHGMQESPEMPDIREMEDLPKELREMAEGLAEALEGLDQVKDEYDELIQNLSGLIGMIPEENIDDQIDELVLVLMNNRADESVFNTTNKLVKTYRIAQATKQAYPNFKEKFNLLAGSLTGISGGLHEIVVGLETMASEIENDLEQFGEIDSLDQLNQLQDGLSTLSANYQQFHNGLVEYTKGVSTLTTSYQALDDGIQELSTGVSSLADGVSELADGTSELHEGTSDLPEQMESEVADLLEEYDFADFEPVSFVSDKNENIGIVQFVLQTEKIEMEEPEIIEDEEEEAKGFWDRLLNLFR